MEPNSYVLIMQYIRGQNNPVSPHELATTLGKSRVTIQSTLKKLIRNGWIEKIGESPKTTYKTVDISLVPHETREREEKIFETKYLPEKSGILETFIQTIH